MMEKDIELIKQSIDTSLFDGVEYFHTYNGVKYYRYFSSASLGCHTGWVKLAYITNGVVSFVTEFSVLEMILLDKLTYS